MVSGNDIKSQVLQRCNLENSGFVADDEWLAMINASAAELYEELVFRYEGYYVAETAFRLESGEYNWQLPLDFYRLLSLECETGDNTPDGYYQLERWSWSDRDGSVYRARGAARMHVDSLRYALQNNRVQFYPRNIAGNRNLRMFYVPRYPNLGDLSADLDATLSLQNWHEYIVVDVCIKVMDKLESDASTFIGKKGELKDRIRRHAGGRDAAKPVELADLDDRAEWNFRGWD